MRRGYGRSGQRGGMAWLPRVVVVAVMLVIISRWWSSDDSGGRGGGGSGGVGGGAGQVEQQTPALNERETQRVLAMLQRPQGIETKDGVAVAILVDTSGSMDQRVQGRAGRRVKKIEAAREAVSDLFGITERLVQEAGERPVVVGLYEFSDRRGQDEAVRAVLPIAPPDATRAAQAVQQMKPDGGTPIGEAILVAKRTLDATGLDRQHILIVTDGENTSGPDPAAILAVLYDPAHGLLPTAVYFVAFDVAADTFAAARDAGAVILPASDAAQLQSTLVTIMTDRILVEGDLPGE